jgi:HK97 family phage prohead protease
LITKDRCYRNFNFEFREADDGSMVVEGQPVVFDQETVIWEYDGVQYKEKIDPRAFDNADMSDVVFNIDHQGKPAAKTKNRTLKLLLRTDGVYMEADLSKNKTGRELFEDIKNGFYDKMSFAFRVLEDSYDRDTRTRTILKVKRLYDVSAVTFPAYEQTSLIARSWAEAQHEIEKKAAEAAEEAEASKDAEALELERLRTQVLSNF